MRPVLYLTWAFACATAAADLKVGLARTNITPPLPFWLSGYAARTNPATQLRSPLWAKALALEDPGGRRAVIVTTDLIGLPRDITEPAAASLARTLGLARRQVLFNSSHTHAGPVTWPNLRVMFDLNGPEYQRAVDYAQTLTHALASVAAAALADLSPAGLAVGQGSADFAINRRQPTPAGMRIGENPAGPVDHDVPVLRITSPDGRLRAVLFGYACHNTTLGGDFYEVDGDYAGATQRILEQGHPGATTLFLMLCGGDQNPQPRGTVERVEQHGRALAEAVERALTGALRPVKPMVHTAYQVIQLEFAPHERATFEAEAKSRTVHRQRRARLMLEAYDRGAPVRHCPYPIQAIRLGDDFTLLGLGGEVVVDYALRLKREYGRERLMVAGYCNDVMAYIPSVRVLSEGGYEAVESMIYYGQPGPFAPSIETNIFSAISDVMAEVTQGR